MNKLDRADINPSGWLRHEQELGMKVKLPADDQLLLVSAGERSRRKILVSRTHVEGFDNFGTARTNGLIVQEGPGKGDYRFSIVHSQNGIFGKTEIKQQTATMPVFRNMCNAKLAA